eukprot:4811663-Prymnesium_polylepis.1
MRAIPSSIASGLAMLNAARTKGLAPPVASASAAKDAPGTRRTLAAMARSTTRAWVSSTPLGVKSSQRNIPCDGKLLRARGDGPLSA